MNDDLKQKLIGLGLAEEQVTKLQEQGVTAENDMNLLTRTEIKDLTGCGLVIAARVEKAFAPEPAVAPVAPATASSTVDPDAEIPEGKKPTAAEVTGFANMIGADPSFMNMLAIGSFANMAGGGAGGALAEMDISSMIPVSTLVGGYKPQKKDLWAMFMGQLERALGGNPIIVINADGSVNRELTVEYIDALQENFDAAEDDIYFDSNGDPYQLVRVGVDAQSIYDADPLDSSRPLQRTGMGKGRINWHGTNLDVRQLIFYAVQTGEINPDDSSDQDWLRDRITPATNRLSFSRKAPKAVRAFNEALRTGQLPTLRVMLNRSPRRPELAPRRRKIVPKDLAGIGRDPRDFDPGDERTVL